MDVDKHRNWASFSALGPIGTPVADLLRGGPGIITSRDRGPSPAEQGSPVMTPAEQHAAVLARLNELEQLARDAGGADAIWTGSGEDEHDPTDWDPHPEPPTSRYGVVRCADGTVVAYPEGTLLRTEARPIGANDPASTLVVLAGRRRIIERHAPERANDGEGVCSRCLVDHGYPDQVPWPCDDFRDAATGLGVDLSQ